MSTRTQRASYAIKWGSLKCSHVFSRSSFHIIFLFFFLLENASDPIASTIMSILRENGRRKEKYVSLHIFHNKSIVEMSICCKNVHCTCMEKYGKFSIRKNSAIKIKRTPRMNMRKSTC